MDLCGNCGEKCGFRRSILKKRQKAPKSAKKSKVLQTFYIFKNTFYKNEKSVFNFYSK